MDSELVRLLRPVCALLPVEHSNSSSSVAATPAKNSTSKPLFFSPVGQRQGDTRPSPSGGARRTKKHRRTNKACKNRQTRNRKRSH
jgi:hypothetical protein